MLKLMAFECFFDTIIEFQDDWTGWMASMAPTALDEFPLFTATV